MIFIYSYTMVLWKLKWSNKVEEFKYVYIPEKPLETIAYDLDCNLQRYLRAYAEKIK